MMLRRRACDASQYNEKQIIGRKRGTLARVPLVAAVRKNQRWSMDFMRDTLADGRKFRTFDMVDDFSREKPALEVDTSLPGTRVVRVLEGAAAVAARGNRQ
jgi:putative transposase